MTSQDSTNSKTNNTSPKPTILPMLNTILIGYLVASLLLSAAQIVNRNLTFCRTLVCLFVVMQVALTAYLFATPHIPTSFFQADGLARLLVLVVTIISAAAFCHSRRYIKGQSIDNDAPVRAQYYGAMSALTMALTLASLSAHLAVTWIFVEITTLSASALIFYRRTAMSIEATWKYVFACSISLVLVYVGILLTSISMGNLVELGLSFDILESHAQELDPFWLKMAFTFIFVGYTAKMGLVPMFTAGIDAKDEAPTPAAAMLSSVVMNAGFVGFFRFYAVLAKTEAFQWARMVVLITALISIFIATVYLVRVNNIKRLFAYSSVEHIGVVMLGVAAGGVGLYAAILHLILHSFAKSAIFMHVGELFRLFGSKMLQHMGHYIRRSGFGAAIVILALLCITAMPPSGMFVSELMVFKSLIDANLWWALIPTVILLCIIVWAISRDTFAILFLPPIGQELVKPGTEGRFPIIEATIQIILLALSIWLGLCTPSFVSELINLSVIGL